MNTPEASVSSNRQISPPLGLGVVGVLWVGCTALQTLFVVGYVPEPWSAVLGFVPGIAGVVALRAAGFSRGQLFLRVAPLSCGGLAILVAIFVFGLAAILPFGVWQGWNWTVALVYAPASGISQELFFRAVLLPALLLALQERPRLALILHAALFALWHIGPFFVGAPIWAAFAVVLVPFVCGIGWGWQVKQDGTVFWAMVQHSLIWVIAGHFPMPE
jgi:membrane protease YdiL (CAAX protease family)